MNLSTYTASTLKAQAGPLAIAANDIVQIGGSPQQLYPVVCADYAAVPNAGATIVAATTVSAFAVQRAMRKAMVINPSDRATFVASAQATVNIHLQITKYTALGTLVKAVTLDSVSTSTTYFPTIVQLSNGNLAVMWQANAITYFAIVDQNLAIVVARTAIAYVAPSIGPIDAIALSAGGFAAAAPATGGAQLAIYSNAGAVVSAPANAGSTSGDSPKLAQLSNGNIAIATMRGAANSLGFSIVTILGAAVVAYTISNAATYTYLTTAPEIAVCGAFFCVAGLDDTNAVAYVYSNAGVLQGARFAAAVATPGADATAIFRLLTDGTAFWFMFNNITTSIVQAPTTGTNYVTSSMTAITTVVSGTTNFDAFIESGLLVVVSNTSPYGYVYALLAGVPVIVGNFTALITAGVSCIAPGGDFTVAMASSGATSYAVQKYAASAILGVSQQTLAANNAGALVSLSTGPGELPTNVITGSAGKRFRHNGALVSGNNGTMYPNCVSLSGLAAPIRQLS